MSIEWIKPHCIEEMAVKRAHTKKVRKHLMESNREGKYSKEKFTIQSVFSSKSVFVSIVPILIFRGNSLFHFCVFFFAFIVLFIWWWTELFPALSVAINMFVLLRTINQVRFSYVSGEHKKMQFNNVLVAIPMFTFLFVYLFYFESMTMAILNVKCKYWKKRKKNRI